MNPNDAIAMLKKRLGLSSMSAESREHYLNVFKIECDDCCTLIARAAKFEVVAQDLESTLEWFDKIHNDFTLACTSKFVQGDENGHRRFKELDSDYHKRLAKLIDRTEYGKRYRRITDFVESCPVHAYQIERLTIPSMRWYLGNHLRLLRCIMHQKEKAVTELLYEIFSYKL